jgi:hypothetical protein
MHRKLWRAFTIWRNLLTDPANILVVDEHFLARLLMRCAAKTSFQVPAGCERNDALRQFSEDSLTWSCSMLTDGVAFGEAPRSGRREHHRS